MSVETQTAQSTTAVLSVESGHRVLDVTLHTIVVTLDGPDVDDLAHTLTATDPTVTRGVNGTLHHGYYVYIAFGLRNIIRRLRKAGLALDAITCEGKPAIEFLAKLFPDEIAETEGGGGDANQRKEKRDGDRSRSA